MSAHLSISRVKAVLVVASAMLALAVGSVGIYWVLSDTAKRRTHDIGVRIALGAQSTLLLRTVLDSGVILIGAGVTVGAS